MMLSNVIVDDVTIPHRSFVVPLRTISLVIKLNEDFNVLLCCAIDVGESVNLFYFTVLSTRPRIYKMILKL